MIKVMLVDDHQIIRDGIKQLLADEGEIRIVAEAPSVKDALRILDVMSVDVVITDLSMPNASGFDLIQAIGKLGKDIKVLVLSMHLEEPYIKKAIENGVNGYIPKDISKYELVQAVHSVYHGEMYFNQEVTKIMMGNMKIPMARPRPNSPSGSAKSSN
jgi:DNA-binding NarL/FixJ family response regulator